MSVILHHIVQSRELEKIKNTEMTNYEILENTRKLWLNGYNDIHSVIKALTSKNCKVNINTEYHFTENSSKKIMNTVMSLFSNDQKIKGFVIQGISNFKNYGNTNGYCLWYGRIDGDNKLILANFIHISTGNWISNKNIYYFNYFEVECFFDIN
jgi:hypothetical protein